MRRRSITGPMVKGTIFIIVTVLATAVLGLTIANGSVGATTGYAAEFTDVTGLNPGDDVRIAGVRVGQVTGVRVTARRYAEVRFSVERGRRLPASVTAAIKYRNLVGQRYLALAQGVGPVDAAWRPGQIIPLSRTTPALDLTELFNGFQPLFQALSPNDVNQLSTEIVQVFQGEDTTVDTLVSHTASLTTTLAQKDQVIGALIDNLNAVLGTIDSRGDELSGMVTTLQELVSGLAEDRKPIGDAISAMSTLTTSTAGLLQDARAPLRQDIGSLGQVAGTLADAEPALDQFLRLLPVKMTDIATLASYGSWLNFYLCSASVGPVAVVGGPPAPPIGIPISEARCQG